MYANWMKGHTVKSMRTVWSMRGALAMSTGRMGSPLCFGGAASLRGNEWWEKRMQSTGEGHHRADALRRSEQKLKQHMQGKYIALDAKPVLGVGVGVGQLELELDCEKRKPPLREGQPASDPAVISQRLREVLKQGVSEQPPIYGKRAASARQQPNRSYCDKPRYKDFKPQLRGSVPRLVPYPQARRTDDKHIDLVRNAVEDPEHADTQNRVRNKLLRYHKRRLEATIQLKLHESKLKPPKQSKMRAVL